MKYEVNGYQVEALDLVEKDGTKVFLVDRWGSLDDAKPTIKEALAFIKERIENGKGLTIKEWAYDAEEGEFVGKLKKNLEKAIDEVIRKHTKLEPVEKDTKIKDD